MSIGEKHHRNAPMEVYILGNFISADTIQGAITITSATVELKLGATPLAGRKQVILINDSSALVYVSFKTPVNLAAGEYFILFSGETIYMDLEPENITPVYARTDDYSTSIRLSEVK